MLKVVGILPTLDLFAPSTHMGVISFSAIPCPSLVRSFWGQWRRAPMCYKLFGKCTFSGTCRSVHCKNLVKHEDVRRSNPGQKSRSQEAWGCLVHLSMAFLRRSYFPFILLVEIICCQRGVCMARFMKVLSPYTHYKIFGCHFSTSREFMYLALMYLST